MRLSLFAGDRRAALRTPLPWIALAVPLLATILVWQALWRGASENATVAFERRTLSAEAAMGARLRGYEQMLVAGAALMATSKEVTRAQWAEYVGRLKLGERYPGVQTMGFAERVRRAGRDQHVRRVRAEGLADYDIRPPGERDDYIVILYSEPFKGRNERVVGLDTYSQPVLRTAIDRAFAQGEAAVTEKVMVPVEDGAGKERPQPGLVMYVPVFRAGMPGKTLEERDAALQGFVFGTVRMDMLFSGVLDRGLAQAVEMRIYDGPNATPESLLADVGGTEAGARTAASVFHRAGAIDVGGRKWTVAFASRPEFDTRAQDAIGVGLLGAGVLASIALFGFALLLVASRKGAVDQSLRDPLTLLFNRGYLDETMALELQRARRAQQPAGLIILDLDGFKAINETSGKNAGELVLRQFARVLELNTRDSDIKCRYGGSEFAVGMPGATIENARARAERLREALEMTSIEHGGKSLGVITLSAGVAAYPRDGEDWAVVARAAHRALYAAKGAGRNRVAVAGETGQPEAAPAG
jgi:diguanylate cyclase (GGDEF)-like protein